MSCVKINSMAVLIVAFTLLYINLNFANTTPVPLKISDYYEGPCPQPMPEPIEMDLEFAMNFSANAKYVPIASSLSYLRYSNLLQGFPLKSWDEFNNMCVEVSTNPFESSVTGFSPRTKVALDCLLEGIGAVNCFPMGKDESVGTHVVVIWTDNKESVLSMSCAPDGQRAWTLISTKPTIENTLKEEVLDFIQKLGFNKENAKEVDYNSCQ